MPPLIASIQPADGARSVRSNRKGHNLTMYSAKPAFSGAGHRKASILKSHEAGSYTKNANYSGLVEARSPSPTNSPKQALGSRSLANAVKSRRVPGQMSDSSKSPTRRSPSAPRSFANTVKSRLEPGQMSDSSKSPTRRSPTASRPEPPPFQPQEPIPGRASPGESIEEAPKTTEPVVSVCRSRSQAAVRAKMDANATLLDPDKDSRRSFGGKSQRDSVFADHMKRRGTAPANVAEPRAKEKEGEEKWSSGSTATTAETGEKDRPSGPKPILHHPVDRPRLIPKRIETTFHGPDGDDRICPDDWSKLAEHHGRTLHKDEYQETFLHQLEPTEHPYQERDYSPPQNQIDEDRLEYDSYLVKHVHHTDINAARVDPILRNRVKTAPDLYSYGRDTSSSPQKKRTPHDAERYMRGRQLEETSSSRLQKGQPREPDQNSRGQLEDIPSSPLQSTKLQSCLKKRPTFEQHQNNRQVEDVTSSPLKAGEKSTVDLQDAGRLEGENTIPLQPSMKIRPKSTADLHDRQYSESGSGGSGGSGIVRTQSAADLNITQAKLRSRDLPVSNTAFTDRSLRMKEGTHARNGVLSHGPGINDDECHPQGECNGNNRLGENRAAGQVSHGVQDHRLPHCIQPTAHKNVLDGSSTVPFPHPARTPATERYGRQAACETDIINSGDFSVDKHLAAEQVFGKEMGRKARNAFANQDYATAAGNSQIKDEPTNRGCIGQGPSDDSSEHITPCLTESPLPLAPISVAARSKDRESLRADGCFKHGFTDFSHKQAVHKNQTLLRFAWKHELRSKSVPPYRDVTRNPVTFDRVLPKEDVCGVTDREDPGPIQAGNTARRPTVVMPGRSYGQTSPRHNPGTDSIQMWKAVTYEGLHSAPNERDLRLAQDSDFLNLCKHTESHKKNLVSDMAAIRDKSRYVTSPSLTECMQWG